VGTTPDRIATGSFVDEGIVMKHTAEFQATAAPRPGSAPTTDPGGLDALMAQVRRAAPLDLTVLLTGETGSGKTRLARLIHDLSPRRGEPFVAVDCSAPAPALVESELFGHAKGAFTGADRDRAGKLAAAGAGTLLLDEVNSLPLAVPGKLLRAVEERVFEPVGTDRLLPVCARVIAAANVDLEAEVEAGRFRADLYHRLNVIAFRVPALRERRGCIVPLAEAFLGESAARHGRADLAGFSLAAAALLESYDWPGNVRELRNAVERAVALCAAGAIEAGDLPDGVRWFTPAGPRRPSSPLRRWKDGLEVERLREVLRRHNDMRSPAARELGISRVALYKKLRKYGLHRGQSPGRGSSRRVAEVA
jgi:DNA-binding NtrC family response regulator